MWAACLAVGGLSSAAVTPLGAATPRAATRITILYDAAATLRTMLGPGKLDPEGDNLYQQIPARGVLPPARQAEKASSRKPVYVSRSLRELDGAQMTQVLRQLIDASPAHLVFIDEASDPVFVGPFADELGTALAALAATPFDDGSTTYATHVHAYVYGSGQMISDPGPRDGIWKALTLMGGVWLETFEGADRTGGRPAAKPWSEATWASRPPAFARMFARRGGNLSRLHFLMSSGRPGDQPLEWATLFWSWSLCWKPKLCSEPFQREFTPLWMCFIKKTWD